MPESVEFEQHLDTKKLAEYLGISYDVALGLMRRSPGVITIRNGPQQRRAIRRMPMSVAQRLKARLTAA